MAARADGGPGAPSARSRAGVSVKRNFWAMKDQAAGPTAARLKRPALPAALICAALLAAPALFGCGIGVAPAPIAHPQYTVPAPVQNQITVTAKPGSAVGGVIPVFVAVSNGDELARELLPQQVYAITESGARVATIPPGEAARMAGGANELTGILESGAIGAGAGGASGAGLGALVGAATRDVPGATVLGGAVGAGFGAFEGAPAGQGAAQRQANQQLNSLALRPAHLDNNFTASGYVFFPAGTYAWVQVLLVNAASGNTESYRAVW